VVMSTSLSERIADSMAGAIEEFNTMQPPERHLGTAAETVLLGTDGVLDSLGLVHLLVTVEQRIAADFDMPITIASEKAFSLRSSPFATVRSLTSYVATLVEEANA
jgi:acyl carrier protein